MQGLSERLKQRSQPIGVGIVGAGYMGGGVLNAVRQAHGMRGAAVFDEGPDAAEVAVRRYSPSTRAVRTLAELCACPEVEVVVDATTSPRLGAEAATLAIGNGKQVVSVNIECDVTLGHALKAKAQAAGVVYTLTAGDEPGELKQLYDHYDALGLRIVAVGKGKNNPLQTAATPDSVRASLPDNGITAEQVASFVDGTKTMFEMGCIANATGLVPDVAGMHGPEANTADLTRIFALKEEGGILSQKGVVDYVTGGDLSGGVFIVVETDSERTMADLDYLKIGKGPRYAFYQRYHNWFLDAPLAIARAVLNDEATVAPLAVPVCEVVAVAKRPLLKGETLDGIGGFCVRGTLETQADAAGQNHLPLGLAENAKLVRDVPVGFTLTYEDVAIDEDCLLWELRREHYATGRGSGWGVKRDE